MIITTRTGETRIVFNAQTNQRQAISIERKVYICDMAGCDVAEEEGHAPEDVDRIPRGWTVGFRPGQMTGERVPIYCPAHSLSDFAGKPVELRTPVDLTLAREMPQNGRVNHG